MSERLTPEQLAEIEAREAASHHDPPQLVAEIRAAWQERDQARRWARAWKETAKAERRACRRLAALRRKYAELLRALGNARRWARAWKRGAKALRASRAFWKDCAAGSEEHAYNLIAAWQERDALTDQLATLQIEVASYLDGLEEARAEIERLRDTLEEAWRAAEAAIAAQQA